MALTNNNILYSSILNTKFQSCVFDDTTMEVNTVISHGINEEEEEGSLSNESASASACATTHSSTKKGYVYNNTSYELEEQESLINFKGNDDEFYEKLMQGSESLLSFQQSWNMVSNENSLQQWNHLSPKSITNLCMVQGFNSFETSSGSYGPIFNSAKEKQNGESSCGWLYSDPNIVPCDDDDRLIKESETHNSVAKKRSSMVMGENMQPANAKKPCTSASKMVKPKSNPSKDPQSVAAKNRRERISERLKILQDLVPNGSKVDLVTMLEKAISYVKFLQLQVKVLAADEFWPVNGGKAPDIGQVKQAIDEILSSQR